MMYLILYPSCFRMFKHHDSIDTLLLSSHSWYCVHMKISSKWRHLMWDNIFLTVQFICSQCSIHLFDVAIDSIKGHSFLYKITLRMHVFCDSVRNIYQLGYWLLVHYYHNGWFHVNVYFQCMVTIVL